MKKVKGKKASGLMSTYIHSRLILPKVLLNLTILFHYKRAENLRNLTKEFLQILTTYNDLGIKDESDKYTECVVDCLGQDAGPKMSIDNSISQLDPLLQRIQKEAGKLLA